VVSFGATGAGTIFKPATDPNAVYQSFTKADATLLYKLGYQSSATTGQNFIFEMVGNGDQIFKSNGSTWLTIGAAGAVTIPGTLGVTGIITAKGAAFGANTSTFNSAAADFSLATQNSHATSPYGHAIKYTAAAPNTTGDASTFFYMADSSAVRAYFSSNGGLANYSANNTNLSDIRTKKDIQPAGAYLSKIMAIPVKTFLYNDQTDTALNLGVIAQDVEAVAPELIDNSGFGETPDDGIPLKTIYQTDFQYALMKALQELAADFQAYKSSHP
jgi:hypothetical protein